MEGYTMADEANSGTEPPLVSKNDEVRTNVNPPMVTLIAPQPLPKPRPGLFEAVIWCMIFLGTQIFGLLLTTGFVMCVFALKAPDAEKFLIHQLEGLGAMSSKDTSTGKSPEIPSEIGQALAYGMLGAQVGSLGLIGLVFPWRIGADWKRQIGFRLPSVIQTLLVVLLVPGFMMLAGGIQSLLQEVGIPQPSMNKILDNTFQSFPWLLTFLAVGFGPGFVEEMWCRGFIGRGLSARYGLIIGVSLTSIMFGLLHCSLSYAIPTAIMGAYLHFVYLASRSIWNSILLHTCNNAIGVWASLTGKAEQLDADPHGLTPVIYLASIALVLFGSIALWTSRARIVPIQGSEEEWIKSIDWKPEYPGISIPPPNSGVKLARAKISPIALLITLASFALLVFLLAS
jgi:uncharacterized protein